MLDCELIVSYKSLLRFEKADYTINKILENISNTCGIKRNFLTF